MPAPPTWRSPWPLRVLWLFVPLLVGPSLAEALDERSPAVQSVGAGLGWVCWAVALVAVLIPRSVTLTVVRVLVPAATAAAIWAATSTDDVVTALAAAATGALALVVLALPGVSDAFVDGSSYGRERRVALRVPFVLLLGPVPLAWAAVVALPLAGALLLASRVWFVGSVLLVVGLATALVGARQLHVLSRRWLVFVPAGVVVHDPLTLTEPLLFQRHLVDRFGPAPADPDALDATGGALGLVLELRSREPFTVGLRSGRRRSEERGVVAVLVTPTQPGLALELARAHRMPVH